MLIYIIGVLFNLVLWTFVIKYGEGIAAFEKSDYQKAVLVSAGLSLFSWITIIFIIIYCIVKKDE